MPDTFWARTDSNSAKNPALNLTGDPAMQITFVPSGPSGDIILDYDGGGIDPDTQVSIGGSLYDFTFELSATLPTLNKDGAQQVPDQFEGDPIYVITIQDYPALGETTRLAFLPTSSATQSEMDAFGNGAVDLQNVDTTTPGTICFAAGTCLLTPDGDRPVEGLKVGDLVVTLDNGPQPIMWISNSDLSWPGSDEESLPILISAGAFGAGAPSRDLVVSPQHKILIAESDDGACDVPTKSLAPAKGLTSLPGIRKMRGKRKVTYHHVLLARHEILFAEGLACESFYPGPAAMRMLKRDQRDEVLRLFPGVKKDCVSGYGPPVRRCLTCREAKAAADCAYRVTSRFLPGAREARGELVG